MKELQTVAPGKEQDAQRQQIGAARSYFWLPCLFQNILFSYVSDNRRNDCNPRRIEAICLLSYP
jgi:hypothetical protein